MPDLDMMATARTMVASGKGILAADESTGTIAKRFATIGVESTEESRRTYRELLFTAADAVPYISGIILFEETLEQATTDGIPFTKFLLDQGILPGIKVDGGTKDLAGAPGEKITEGLDNLRDRLTHFRTLGAYFTKWRAVIDIANNLPSRYCIEANAHALARYAALSQEANLVPIVEPEVLMDGDHDINVCEKVTEEVLRVVFDQLSRQRILLEAMILKPNMVIAGKNSAKQATIDEVAKITLRVLRQCVPPAVPGIAFLSGGQSEQEATAHLNAMNTLGPHPWELSFSYGRALQASALKAWAGKDQNTVIARNAFVHRARMNGLARNGDYRKELD